MSEREQLALYEQLEPWAVGVARAIARAAAGLSRWLDDLEQEARIALWDSIQHYNGNGSAIGFVKQRVRRRVLNAAKRYGRWDDREWTGLLDGLDRDDPNL